MKSKSAPFSVTIVGGSLAGLAAAAELTRTTAADVTVVEQSAGKLEGRGAGIVMQPEIEWLLRTHGVHPAAVCVTLGERRFLHRHSQPRTIIAPQRMTAWDTLYRVLRNSIGDARYQQGIGVTDVEQADEHVTVTFGDHTVATPRLVIGADGIASITRRSVFARDPGYSGYVAWRGLESESDLPADLAGELTDRFTLYSIPGVQFLCYLVPGPDGETEPGQRRVNWVWYINTSSAALDGVLTGASGRRYDYFLPADDVSGLTHESLAEAAVEYLPPLLARLVAHSRPFLQPVMDVAGGRMRRGAVFLIGDAAGTVRPHTASGTSKSIADAVLLATAFRGWVSGGPLPESHLAAWEKDRLRSLREIAATGLATAAASNLGGRRNVDIWTAMSRR
jgi:2-polyprenyl-6-methoxyphenol hydroxylase-like FAD-dependent oxidoreductase